MADSISPNNPRDNDRFNPVSSTRNASAYPTNPMTWQEMNDFLFRVQSGSLSKDAVGGISVAFQNSSYIEDGSQRRRRERHHTEDTQFMLSLQRQMMDMATEAMALFDALTKDDPHKAERLRALNDLWRQDLRAQNALTRVGQELERLKTQTGSNRDEIMGILQTGKASKDPSIQRSAWIAEERYYSSQNVITVTHRAAGDIGERPQHLVYQDEGGRMYLKTGETKLYIDTLSADEQEKMNREIERQRNATGRKEKFGNEDPAMAARFEKAQREYTNELATAGGFIVGFDKLLSQGRNFRSTVAAKEQEYMTLMKDQENIRLHIMDLESGFHGTRDSRRQLGRMKEILTEMELKQVDLEREIKSFSSDVEQRQQRLEYFRSGNYDNKTVLSGLPDDVFRRDALAAQEELQRRLQQVEAEKAQLEANRETAERQEERTRQATERMGTLRQSSMDTAITRRDWISNMGGGSGTKTDYVRDAAGNVVHYDSKLGLFFRLETQPGGAAPKTVHYRDPADLVDFFTQAWQGHKFLGNEKELGSITFKQQYDFVNAQLGRNAMMEAALRNSMDMKERLLENESARLRQSLSDISSGSVRPDVAASNAQKAAADGIDPLSQSNYRPAFSDAVTNGGMAGITAGTPAGGPGQDAPKEELKKPVISITSDANR